MSFKVYYYKKVNSTNETSIKKINQNIEKGVVVSDTQKKGKGQYGKKWISLKGNIFLSIFFNISNQLSLDKINDINCSILKKALLNEFECNMSIKPPNDILINKKKFVGILQETIIRDKKKYIIIGIGINLVKSPHIEQYPTTNILDETNKTISKKKLIKTIINEFEKNLKKFALNA